ncbi:unnamed protein product [Amoebophrya sp. A120]|nr:unnamed protein product [Amoebophrya sp. A120]|eukprot:GSA120T00012815001.1
MVESDFVRECITRFATLPENEREDLLVRLRNVHAEKKQSEQSAPSTKGSIFGGKGTGKGKGQPQSNGGSSQSSSIFGANLNAFPAGSPSSPFAVQPVRHEPALIGNDAIDVFFREEEGSALLTRNDCVKPASHAEFVAKVANWLSFVSQISVDKGMIAKSFVNASPEERGRLERIFRRDADRTMLNEHRRLRFIETLTLCNVELQDYHQGGGFITAFLSLFLRQEDVARVIWHLHRHEMVGYFKGAAQGFVSDSRVFHELFRQFLPNLNAHLERHQMNSENTQMWCIKFFVGMGVHFMPFTIVFQYFEACLQHGHEFFFKFGISWLQHLETHLMLARSTSELGALLRNEHPTDQTKSHPGLWKGSVKDEIEAFEEILANAHSVNLNRFGDFQQLRIRKAAEFEQLMIQRAKRMEELADEVENCEGDFSDEDD